MDMPPSRYRVVERGRRLEVIDSGTSAGREIVSPPRFAEPGEKTAASWLPKQVRFDGTKRWTTHPLYDAKGPRTVTIMPGSIAENGYAFVAFAAVVLGLLVAFAPWALIAIGAGLFNPKARGQLRQWSTRAIDRIAAAN